MNGDTFCVSRARKSCLEQHGDFHFSFGHKYPEVFIDILWIALSYMWKNKLVLPCKNMEIIFGLVSQIIDLNKNEGVVLLHTWYFNIEVTLKHKKTVQQNWKLAHHLLMSVQTYMTLFYTVEHKRRYFEKRLSVFVHTMEVSCNLNCLVANILQSNFYCDPQRKVMQVWNSMRASKWSHNPFN